MIFEIMYVNNFSHSNPDLFCSARRKGREQIMSDVKEYIDAPGIRIMKMRYTFEKKFR